MASILNLQGLSAVDLAGEMCCFSFQSPSKSNFQF
jgi:hypothetical protein